MNNSYKNDEYELIINSLKQLIITEAGIIANLANISALLNQYMSNLNWVGFYMVNGDNLILGPFQGRPACLIIKKGKGVCGCSWGKNETVVVENVHDFPGHITCDCNSKSEIVIPINLNNQVIGVLDLDSPILKRFDNIDRENLEIIVSIIEKLVFSNKKEES
ncbi:MAG: GAF domain-containing protein [Erysipelotrichales bacterium]|nr:GAF domain-containing protein [Erysipelotrichales bacterium]